MPAKGREEAADTLTCEKCLKTSNDLTLSHQHKKAYYCKEKIKCEKCGIKVKETVYEKHVMNYCITLACEKCGEIMSEAKLEKHLKRQLSCVLNSPQCEHCKNYFSSAQAHRKHLEKQHNKYKGRWMKDVHDRPIPAEAPTPEAGLSRL
jgi:hypothetical protein